MHNFNTMDLNLLRHFACLYERRSVTAAAHQVGLTQSAMSHVLKRLRDAFGDPLFVRDGKALVPTKRADQLYAPVMEALDGLMEAVQDAAGFDPQSTDRQFTLAMADYVELLCLPQLMRRLPVDAPKAALRAFDPGNQDLPTTLQRADLAIARYTKAPPNYHRQTLWREEFVTVCSRSHPRLQRADLTLDAFLAEGHMMVSTDGQGLGMVDQHLAAIGHRRTMVLKTGFFYSPLRVAAAGDLLATVPKRLAEALQHELDLRLFEPPLDLPGFDVSMVWAPHQHRDPGHAWFRRWLKKAVAF
ncbi:MULTISPECIES: LysR family transcriptional regulator [Kordiimonas]|jgi:DNA-binding transcriptional LysR family regulator|uniref:LysR family transcriptional regulator n=1 Tax=Kordiimonas TaxID=288021 RepID=UPI00257D473D|nr:LysR family transcriptional regulator [Kordiimonas sp. UBA4487]